MKNKSLKTIIILVTLVVAFCAVGFLVAPKKSLLITEIEDFRQSHGTGDGLDLTPVLEKHLKIGTEIEEVTAYLKDMGFQVHNSWKDKNILVADYKPHSALKNLNVVQNYRVVLHSSEGRLKSYKAEVKIESP